jgi:hypothetical protein
VAARTEQLKIEIDRTRKDLAGHVAELKVELGEVQRTAVKIIGGAAAAFVVYKVAKFIWKRTRY